MKVRSTRAALRSIRLLTGKYTAIPAFIGIMGLVFWLTFGVIGAWLAAFAGHGNQRLDRI